MSLLTDPRERPGLRRHLRSNERVGRSRLHVGRVLARDPSILLSQHLLYVSERPTTDLPSTVYLLCVIKTRQPF